MVRRPHAAPLLPLFLLAAACAPAAEDGTSAASSSSSGDPPGSQAAATGDDATPSDAATAPTASNKAGDPRADDPDTWPGDPIPDGAPIQETPTGLRYVIYEQGAGEPPGAMDTIACQYAGYLANGTQFDASANRGPAPASFSVNQVIPGWTEGLQLMKPGAKFKFIIPGAIGYGPRGNPGAGIGPNAMLVFDVELVEVTNRVDAPSFYLPEGDDVLVSDSGIRYQYLQRGAGNTVGVNDKLAVRYAAWTAEGRLFDSSYQRPTAVPMSCNGISMEGLVQCLQLMREGDVARFHVPKQLGFGPEAVSTGLNDKELVFHIEMKERTPGPDALPLPEFALPDAASLNTSDSGLQWQVIRQGSGGSPGPTDQVTVHYAGWLTDGTLFDSSYPRGEPTTFPLNQVIPGWTEGVQLMSPGAMYRFVIPGDLAYGARGSPPKIPPDATLVFDIELLTIGG